MSLNILGARKKAQLLINLVKKYNIDIFLLRETFIDTPSDFKQMLQTLSIKEGACCEGTKSSRGTCTFNIKNNFEITEYATDKDGRLVITNVESKDKDEKFTLVKTYVPMEK